MTYPLFDRGDLLALLRKRVSGFQAGYRQNLALIGPAGMGKSTLIRELLAQESKPGSLLLSFYLEIGLEESASEWASRFIRTVLYAVLQLRKTEDFPARLSGFLELCAGLVPRTAALAARVEALSEAGRLDEAYEHLWELPGLVTQETGHRVLLVLDEFHRLRGFPLKEPFRSLGRKIMVQSTTLYVVASSEPAAAYSILAEGLALLFGKFEAVEMPPLTPAACRKAIRSGRAEGLEDPFTEYLLMDLAQGHPYRLDRLLECWRRQDSLADLLEALFLGSDSPFRQDFERRLRLIPAHRSRTFCLQVLESVAAGVHRLSHLAVQTQRPISQVVSALRLLQDCRLVEKEGSFYRVPERLFQIWLITAYPILQGIDLIGPDRAAAHFHRVIDVWTQRVREAAGRPMQGQLYDLLQLWDDEVVELDGRKVLLPRFRQVERVPGLFEGASLLGRPMKRLKGGWWVVPWQGALVESQARQIVQQFRSFAPLKEHRKVLIGASPAEVNARLVLQEAKVRFWDLPALNQLLDLYGLTRLPVPAEADHPPALTVSLDETGLPAHRGSSSSQVAG